MEKLSDKSLTKQLEKEQVKHISGKHAAGCCPHCGFPETSGTKFCEQCGFAFEEQMCPGCNAHVESHWEICPACGRNLTPALCSFCGKGMEKNEKFCQHCGNSREGITCNHCGTRNFRNFCFKCNTPLNELAQAAVQSASADKQYQKVLELAKELAALEEELHQGDDPNLQDEIEPGEGVCPANGSGTKEQKREEIQNEYLSGLLQLVSTPVAPKEAPPAPVQKPMEQVKIKKREKLATYQQKVAQMQEMMDKMVPPADAPPCIQRDYYSARKVPVLKKTVVTEPAYWVCNLCGAHHNNPSSCAQPELGGKWVYKNTTTTEEIFAYEK